MNALWSFLLLAVGVTVVWHFWAKKYLGFRIWDGALYRPYRKQVGGYDGIFIRRTNGDPYRGVSLCWNQNATHIMVLYHQVQKTYHVLRHHNLHLEVGRYEMSRGFFFRSQNDFGNLTELQEFLGQSNADSVHVPEVLFLNALVTAALEELNSTTQ